MLLQEGIKPTPKMLKKPVEGDFWQADHIQAVAEGGGQCGIGNFRTLCTRCHGKETAKLHVRLKEKKNAEAARGSKDIRSLFATKHTPSAALHTGSTVAPSQPPPPSSSAAGSAAAVAIAIDDSDSDDTFAC